MRKNRLNSGYIGKDIINPYSGSISLSNIHQIASNQLTKPYTEIFTPPTDGGGYGVTAIAGLTNGTLIWVYISNYLSGGTGYIPQSSTSNANIFKVSGGGGPTAWGRVETVAAGSQNTINDLTLYRSIESIGILDPGYGYPSAPNTPSFSGGVASSSITASINGFTLDVTNVSSGKIIPGSLVVGNLSEVAENTVVLDFITGRGGTGTYRLSKGEQTLSSRLMSTSCTAKAGNVIMDNDRISGVTLLYKGLYISPPTITLSGVTPTFAGSLYPIMERYTGYKENPTVQFFNPTSGPGSTAFGATASALVVYELDNIGISAGGQNYTSAPSVTIEKAEYSDTTAIATVSGGAVTEITKQTGSVRFISTPNIKVGGWRNLPTVVEGEDKFVGSYAVFNTNENYVAFAAGGTYNVDWGDGTTGTFNRNATAQKTYTISTFEGITQNAIENGYKTVIITVTPVSGARLEGIDFNVRHSSFPASANVSTNWLNMKMATDGLTHINSITVTSSSSVIRHRMLESFEFVGSPGNTGGIRASNGFANCTALRKYNAPLLTRNTLTMGNMFSGCRVLTEVSDMETSKNTDASFMFQGCRNLKNAPSMNTINCTNMASMFDTCSSLETVPLYNTSKVTSFSSMFNNCQSLISIPPFDTSAGTNFNSMFSSCRLLELIPNIDTSSATTLAGMFSGCYNIKTIPPLNTSKVTSMASMFSNCPMLVEVPFMNTSKVTDMGSMFNATSSLKTIPQFDTSSVTTMLQLFASSGIIDIPELDMSNVTNTQLMFSSCPRLLRVPSMYMPKVTSVVQMFTSCSTLFEIGSLYLPQCSDFSSMFSSCDSLEYPPEIFAKAFANTGTVSYSSMFSSCSRLIRLPLFSTTLRVNNTSTSYGSMFSGCSTVVEIPEYNFLGATGSTNTSALTSVFSTMYNLNRIKAINLCQSFSLPNPNMMGSTALNELYTNLAVVGASGANVKTITVTGSLGVANDNTMIAISKGWAVTG